MTSISIASRPALLNQVAQIKAASPKLAIACEYLGSAMRATFIDLAVAFEGGDMSRAAELAERIRSSELVVGLAGKLHHLRDRANHVMAALSPWAKVIVGLVGGLAGYFFAAELGLVLAGLIMVGGFMYAIHHAQDVILREGLRRVRE